MSLRRAIFLGLVSGIACVSVAFAQVHTETVVKKLGNEGFDNIKVRRTLLGFDRIVGVGPLGRREIVLNPKTGAIKRDYLYVESDSDRRDAPRQSARPSQPTPPPRDENKPAPPDLGDRPSEGRRPDGPSGSFGSHFSQR